jgi:hypothetical protein
LGAILAAIFKIGQIICCLKFFGASRQGEKIDNNIFLSAALLNRNEKIRENATTEKIKTNFGAGKNQQKNVVRIPTISQ